MLSKNVVLVGAEADLAEALAGRLRAQGLTLQCHDHGDALLADPDAFDHGFYLLRHGGGGASPALVSRLRERTEAGVVMLLDAGDRGAFVEAVDAGADMGLFAPVPPDGVMLVMHAVRSRIERHRRGLLRWTLDAAGCRLHAPDGARVRLSLADVRMLECFVDAGGAVVTRDTLVRCLGLPETPTLDNTLHATVYRLRRRIERASSSLVPLQSEPRQGYVFRAPLVRR